MIRAFLLFITQIPLILLGVPLVWLMVPHAEADESTRRPYSQYPELGSWVFTNFGGWWGNPCDGLLGDKRGWWANYCREHYGKPETHPYCMWKWAAFRNPINGFSRLVAGIDVSRCEVEKVWGQDVVQDSVGMTGWQYLRATRDDGKTFPRLYVVIPWWFKPTSAIMLDIGWKIKLSHNGTSPDAPLQDRMKGDVFTISPWKTL